jgi:DNA replicative helicase MCM subunit Mcm2 (Cdc46/Mcm family)
VATIRDCFLIDLSLYTDLGINYCVSLKNIQDMLNKLKKTYLSEVVSMSGNIVYTSDIIIDLKKAFLKLHKTYIPPNVPKLIVES